MLRDAATDVFNLQYALQEKFSQLCLFLLVGPAKPLWSLAPAIAVINGFTTTVHAALPTSLVLNFFTYCLKNYLKNYCKKLINV